MSASRFLQTLFAVLFVALPALQPAAAQQQELQVRVTQVDNSNFPEVTVYISITDLAGEPVGVDPNLIQLSENGVAVQPEEILGSGEAGALTTLLVIDISGSMNNRGKLAAAQAASKAYVALMRPTDQVGLITFNTRVTYLQALTADQAVLNDTIDTLTAQDDTAMYDALGEAVQVLGGLPGRKAVIVLTDGLDNQSQLTADELISEVSTGSLSISTIGLGDPSAGSTLNGLDEAGLRELAARAGGVYGFASDERSLEALYETYGRALQSEYRITYTSPSSLRDGLERALTVSLAASGSLPAASGYNPGGVLPEVQGTSWGIFLGVLALLVLLALLPTLLRLLPAGKKAPPGKSKGSRIKLK